jgi:hypothetical protein
MFNVLPELVRPRFAPGKYGVSFFYVKTSRQLTFDFGEMVVKSNGVHFNNQIPNGHLILCRSGFGLSIFPLLPRAFWKVSVLQNAAGMRADDRELMR